MSFNVHAMTRATPEATQVTISTSNLHIYIFTKPRHLHHNRKLRVVGDLRMNHKKVIPGPQAGEI